VSTRRAVEVALALIVVVLVSGTAYPVAADNAPQRGEAAASQTTGTTTGDGTPEPTASSGSLGRIVAGFVLIGGWSVAIVIAILRAQRRRGTTARPSSAQR